MGIWRKRCDYHIVIHDRRHAPNQISCCCSSCRSHRSMVVTNIIWIVDVIHFGTFWNRKFCKIQTRMGHQYPSSPIQWQDGFLLQSVCHTIYLVSAYVGGLYNIYKQRLLGFCLTHSVYLYPTEGNGYSPSPLSGLIGKEGLIRQEGLIGHENLNIKR